MNGTNHFLRRARAPLGALVGVGGFVGLSAVTILPPHEAIADAGYLPPVLVAAAEDSRLEVLEWGETFGEILYDANLDPNEQANLLAAFREHENPRSLVAGTEITIRYARGGDVPRGFDVAVTKEAILRIDRGEAGWQSSLVPVPFFTDTISVAGTIERELWTALTQSPDLEGMSLADRADVLALIDGIFQSTVDFWREIYPGDSYRFVLERQVRPDGVLRGRPRILAAEVESRGSPHSAFWFDVYEDGRGAYYDGEGVSLKRAFLLRPVELGYISSRFSPNRMHPILDVRRPHLGTDVAAPVGTPVMTTGDGVITFRGVNGGYGNMVEVRHSNGYVSRYAHLSAFQRGQSVGSRVRQGDKIGEVGMTGLATGPHVHYEMYRNGAAFDSQELGRFMPPGDPIPTAARERWDVEFRARNALLDRLPTGPDLRLAQASAQDANAPVSTQ